MDHTTPVCAQCDDTPATVLDHWTHQRYCTGCAVSLPLCPQPLGLEDIHAELAQGAGTEGDHYTPGQDVALTRIAELLLAQQRRIGVLEEALAKLTGRPTP